MSMDSADDLEYAEGLLSVAAEMLRETLGMAVEPEIQGRIVALLGEWDSFCRPTCQADQFSAEDLEEMGGCLEGDCCGCPCHSREEDHGPGCDGPLNCTCPPQALSEVSD